MKVMTRVRITGLRRVEQRIARLLAGRGKAHAGERTPARQRPAAPEPRHPVTRKES